MGGETGGEATHQRDEDEGEGTTSVVTITGDSGSSSTSDTRGPSSIGGTRGDVKDSTSGPVPDRSHWAQ